MNVVYAGRYINFVALTVSSQCAGIMLFHYSTGLLQF